MINKGSEEAELKNYNNEEMIKLLGEKDLYQKWIKVLEEENKKLKM
jgi:hypothetical protein